MARRNEVRGDGILGRTWQNATQVAPGKSGFKSFVGPRAKWHKYFGETISGGSHVENKARDNDKQFSVFLPLTSSEYLFILPELQFQHRCGSEASISLFLMAGIKTRQC